MFRLSDQDRSQVAAAGIRGGQNRALLDAVHDLYARFEDERTTRQPICDASGRCCRFEAYGHRLFVSTVELAAFVASDLPTPPAWDGTGCPYQVDGLCSAREGRPFGCRVYFCDPTSKDWQTAQYEHFHAAIRELHERFDVPYVYAEWREALSAVGLPRNAAAGPVDSESPVGKRRIVLTVVPDRR